MSSSSSTPSSLPAQLKVAPYAEARIKEILGLEAIINAPRHGTGAAQQLPRHLRRRAVSHHPNRLPRRLRERHLAGRDKSGGDANKPSKRPSRKHRRRPKNLLEEYNRRQRDPTKKWLETHLWHAKRFHLVTKWGYRLADFPNDKCFRACHRAAAAGCLMRDVSYLCCLQISGRRDDLVRVLDRFTAREVDLGFAADTSGLTETAVTLFHPGKYPAGVIGEASCLWNCEEDESGDRSLWLWLHPAYYDEFLQCLFKELGIKKPETVEAEAAPPPAKKARKEKVKKDVNAAKLAPRNVPFDRTPKHVSNCGRITVVQLRDTLNRFRLTGPKSQVVLRGSLVPSEVEVNGEEKSHWWQKYYSEGGNLDRAAAQFKAWEDLSRLRPGEVRPGAVLALTVRDPRVMLPAKRDGIRDDEDEEPDVKKSCPVLVAAKHCASPIWDPEARDRVSLDRCPDAEINRRRSEMLVPGAGNLEMTPDESRVPAMLVHKSGSLANGFGAGWDLILPAGWGMSFWMNLTFQGARVGGLREERHLALESLRLGPVSGCPDGAAGSEARREREETLRAVHFSHPPDKRCNFAKVAVASPFGPPWERLVKDWSSGGAASGLSVVRDRTALSKAQKCLIQGTDPGLEKTEKYGLLLPVSVELCGKGGAESNSLICLPTPEDLMRFTGGESSGPREPERKDPNEEERRELREAHKKRKASMRRRWKERKDELAGIRAAAKLRKDEADGEQCGKRQAELESMKRKREEENRAFNDTMEKLWVPGSDPAVRDSCSRTVLGFVVEGGYSYRIGRSVGVGFAASAAVAEACSKGGGGSSGLLVLVRRTTDSQYRFARLNISMTSE